MNIADMRAEYTSVGLRREAMAPDPVDQFRVWFDQASGENHDSRLP